MLRKIGNGTTEYLLHLCLDAPKDVVVLCTCFVPVDFSLVCGLNYHFVDVGARLTASRPQQCR